MFPVLREGFKKNLDFKIAERLQNDCLSGGHKFEGLTLFIRIVLINRDCLKRLFIKIVLNQEDLRLEA